MTEENFERVAFQLRMGFQIELLKELAPPDEQGKRDWIEENKETFSDAIDKNPTIRPLVESGDREKWRQAIKMIEERLRQGNGLRNAA